MSKFAVWKVICISSFGLILTEHQEHRNNYLRGGEPMNEDNKKMIEEMVSVLTSMSRDELLKTYGFALGQLANQPAA